jgi:NTE family protein
MGMYHIGVVQALIEADCLPKIIAGSSAGSIIASILATHTREQLFEQGVFNFSAFANQKKVSLF